MGAPISPTNSEPHSTPSSAALRLVRRLVVDARAHDEGVAARLYCKVVLPTTSSSPEHHLLTLDPLTSVRGSSAHALPLHPSDSPAVHAAARNLSLQSALPPPDDDEALRRVRRRSSAASDLLSRLSSSPSSPGEATARRTAEVSERDGEVLLTLAGAGQGQGAARGHGGAQRPVSPHGNGSASVEFLVVLDLETAFGPLRLPRFANAISIPTPLCLRSELLFTLPSPPASAASSAWDLSIRPSLSNAESTDLKGATQVTGSFPSSPSLCLRWAPQRPSGEDAPLVLPRAALETAWTLQEDGAATAEVRISGEFELAGLREKAWLELDLATAALPTVSSYDGEGDTPVIGYELAPAGAEAPSRPLLSRSSSATTASTASLQPAVPAASPFLPPLPRELDDFASPLDDSFQSLPSSSVSSSTPIPFPFTPTPASRRRPLNPRATEARPPSFTSLFDTAPPAPPVLDTSFAEMQTSPGKDERRRDAVAVASGAGGRERGGLSLLKTPAPFDPEASAMDMSFEVSALEDRDVAEGAEGDEASETGQSPSPVPPLLLEPRPADERRPAPTARLRVQLGVGDALRRFAALAGAPEPPAAPTIACQFVLAFPAEALGFSSARLALPPFSIPAAHTEDALVSVSPASPAWRVDVLSSAFDGSVSLNDEAVNAPPSPLPAVGRSARWTTSRNAGGAPGKPVQVELRLADAEEPRSSAREPLLADETLLTVEDETPPASETEAVRAVDELLQPGDAPGIADEQPALDVSTRTERPAAPSLPSPSPSSSPSPSPSPPPTASQVAPAHNRSAPTRSLSHVRVEVTTLPPPASSEPTAPWRLLHRYVFAQPYTGELRAPDRASPLRCWDASGAEVDARAVESSTRTIEVDALKEAVFEVRMLEEKVRGAASVRVELLELEVSVAKLEVFVAVPHGYSVEAGERCEFGRSSGSHLATFTRFSAAADRPAPLDLVFSPLPRPEATVAPVVPPAPAPARRDATPSWSPRSFLMQVAAVLAALVLYHALSPSTLPPPSSSMLAAVSSTPALSTASVVSETPVLSTVTSILRTPVTHTVTATATVERVSTSTVTITSTSTERRTSTTATTATRTVTLILSPSSSASAISTLSPHPTFSDDWTQLPTVALAVPTPALTRPPYELAQETAADVLAALRVWVERGKLRARGWWSVLREYLGL